MQTALLAEYGTYHRNPRNRSMHEIGIPLIVLAILALLALVRIGPLDLAEVAIAVVFVFYLTVDVPSAVGALVGYGLLYLLALHVPWYGALALFAAGWIFQFVGHAYEGKKPAFFTNLVHLLVGPLWIVALAIKRVEPAAPA
ncbi:MAG: DUF962 domain-containing protein [Candidatus Eremiobacteraeota bacterium]|nr:DUF962 domain-containing protein [Candidatus Eremiobacteraeota bacterium]